MLIIQIGCGAIGSELVRQVLARREALASRYGLQFDYLALIDRQGALHCGVPLAAETILAGLAAKAGGGNLAEAAGGRAIDHWTSLLPAEPCIVVDVTAADGMEQDLITAIGAGHRVVLANKRPLSASLTDFQALTAHGATRYEATVGAGLPVISTLQSLIDSGDELQHIEASMSGTLGFLFSELERGVPFSSAVRTAHSRGYTEPDPRDDLGGADVARKALILARTCGLAWETATVQSQSLFPASMSAFRVEKFMQRLPDLDEQFEEQVHTAHRQHQVMRYVAIITPEGAQVGPLTFPNAHPLAALRGADNLFSITTRRYAEHPLIVRGPGAGIAVTAAGVLGDIIATARELQASMPAPGQ